MDETVFCKACESGEITTAKGLLRHVDASSLEQWRTSEDRTCLHVAVLAGDPDLLRKLVEMLVAAKLTDLIKKTDNQGDTALHLAVRKYRVDLVKPLLDLGADLCDCENKTEGRTCLHVAEMKDITNNVDFFEACQCGDITKAKGLFDFELFNTSSLKEWRTSEKRTCLHMAVVAGDPGLLRELAKQLPQLIKEEDKQGDTALHLAVRKYRVDLVKQLLDLGPDLCDCKNNKRETPLQMAVRLGFVEAVELLIKGRKSNALQIRNDFLFHLVVGRNQVKLVKILIESLKENKEDLSKLVNQPYRPATNPSDNEGKRATNPQHVQPIDAADEHRKEKGPTNASGDGGDKPSQSAARNKNKADEERPGVEGDTPLHIAARNKYDEMLGLLLTVDKVNKNARNDDDKTALEIAREVTEYHESLGIIKMLTDYPPKCKPFMYCAPQVSREKHKKATEKINEAFRDRREAELVVAALLATMTFTAALALPGGFNTEAPQSEQGHSQAAKAPQSDQGSPILISYVSFKLFLIFDCLAFFIALLVCIMWEMSSALTTRDKMLFMTVNGLLVCCSFGFTAYGFMAAVYAMLAHKVETFAWVVLGSLIFITLCGIVAFMHQFAIFAVGRARFHRLYGVSRLLDNIVEKVWNLSERLGLLHILRGAAKLLFGLIAGDIGLLKKFCRRLLNIFCCTRGGSGGQNDIVHGGGSRSSSPFLQPSNV